MYLVVPNFGTYHLQYTSTLEVPGDSLVSQISDIVVHLTLLRLNIPFVPLPSLIRLCTLILIFSVLFLSDNNSIYLGLSPIGRVVTE